jgi:YesN/AraC family two-component response regulator
VFTALSVRRNYDPVRNLVKLLQAHHDAPEREPVNEFEFINAALDGLITEKKRYESQFEQYAERVRQAMLTRLLLGESDEELYSDFSLQPGESQASAGALKTRVMRYVTENYSNPELSVALIADTLGFNPAYLSSAFKRQAGMGILEYISRIRTDNAVIALKSTGSNVNEVALRVGCVNAKTFTRIFKKNTGVTPSQFKELYAKQQPKQQQDGEA